MTKEELPSRAIVWMNIKNKFVRFIKGIRSNIAAAPGNISINHDLWTEDHSSTAYFGLTAQWIEVKDLCPWTLRAKVIGFYKIVGDHGGHNLGRQLLKVTDCTGITSKKQDVINKVCHYLRTVACGFCLTCIFWAHLVSNTARAHHS